jgi:hypothetical protein
MIFDQVRKQLIVQLRPTHPVFAGDSAFDFVFLFPEQVIPLRYQRMNLRGRSEYGLTQLSDLASIPTFEFRYFIQQLTECQDTPPRAIDLLIEDAMDFRMQDTPSLSNPRAVNLKHLVCVLKVLGV